MKRTRQSLAFSVLRLCLGLGGLPSCSDENLAGDVPENTGGAAPGSTGGSGGAAGGSFPGGSSSAGSSGTGQLGGSAPVGGSSGTAGTSDPGGAGNGGTLGGGAGTGGTSDLGGASGSGGASAGGAAGIGGTSGANTGGVAGTGGSGTGGVAGTSGSGSGGTAGSIGPGTGRTYYVTPTGLSTNSGMSFAAAMDFATARARVVAGDTILLQAGTYSVAYVADAKNTITFSQAGQANNPIRVITDGNGRAKFDFSFPLQGWVQDSFGFFVTGNYWYFEGIDITRAGYQGVYVTGQHNTFENCAFYDNRNTGLEINKGGAYTTVINSDAYRNYDPKKLGSMADGFGPKETQGAGNRFIGCRAWENSDDGFDAYDSPERVTFERCSAFRNGIDVWNYGGFDGNGNGFKIGGNAKQANHQLTQCTAFANPVKGFDQNNNTGGITIYNSTAYQNGTNFALGGTLNSGQQHVLKNNVSLGAGDTIANATQQNNSWNTGFSASNGDFVSLDIALGSAARPADGSLPVNDFLRPKAGSALIDRGVNVGLPFLGAAPDLGAVETQ